MKNIILSAAVGVIILPTVVAGISVTNSLIDGKTPEEAVVILADQIDLILGRVEVVENNQQMVEQKQIELEATASSTNASVDEAMAAINALSAKNAKLEADNLVLAQKNQATEQAITTLGATNQALQTEITQQKTIQQTMAEKIIEITPVIEITGNIVLRQPYNYTISSTTPTHRPDFNLFNIFSVYITDTGNTPIEVKNFSVSVHGSYNPTDLRNIRIRSGADRSLGVAPIINGVANVILNSPDKGHSYIIAVETSESFEGDPREFYLTLDSIESNASSLSGLPITSNIIHIVP